MILSLRLNEYAGRRKIGDLDDTEYAELRAVVPGLPEERPEHYWSLDNFLVDDAAVRTIVRLGIGVSIEDDPASQTMIVKLQNRLEALELRTATRLEAIAEGAAVQIAVPDIGLMTVRYTHLLENACTDVLQDHLERGWRILAVCPPNAQRRPDYVLGRSTNPEPENQR